CADDEQYQRLGCQRLDKPTSMKQRFARVEEMQQHIEGQKVEDRTDRSDENHEIADQTDIPALRLLEIRLINIVRWNGELGHIIKKIVQQDLRGQHRQERQKERSRRHADHIAKVRTRAHQQVLHHVAKGFAPLDDAVMEDPQAGLNENNVGSLASHVNSAGHGNANIGRVKRWCVVDAVTHEPNRMAVVFESQENAILLSRGNASEYARLLGIVGQRRVRHAIEILAGDDFAGFDAYLRADVPGDAVVVTRYNLHVNAILL